MDKVFQGRRAFVSGSTSGIGAAIARKLASEGATVIIHGRDHDRAREVANGISAMGGTAHIAVGDLQSDEAVAEVARVVEQEAGGIDILANVAGAAGDGTWDNSTADVFIDQYDLNTVSGVRLINAMLPGMRSRRWGRIIQISSIAANRPLANQVPAYCAAKAALLVLTASLATTVAADNVMVNSISPGFVLTAGLQRYFLALPDNAGKSWADIEPAIAETLGIRVGRLGRPEDIAGLVAFLAGPGGDWITGSSFRIDGGNLCTVG